MSTHRRWTLIWVCAFTAGAVDYALLLWLSGAYGLAGWVGWLLITIGIHVAGYTLSMSIVYNHPHEWRAESAAMRRAVQRSALLAGSEGDQCDPEGNRG